VAAVLASTSSTIALEFASVEAGIVEDYNATVGQDRFTQGLALVLTTMIEGGNETVDFRVSSVRH
jgi:hypothetical protein